MSGPRNFRPTPPKYAPPKVSRSTVTAPTALADTTPVVSAFTGAHPATRPVNPWRDKGELVTQISELQRMLSDQKTNGERILNNQRETTRTLLYKLKEADGKIKEMSHQLSDGEREIVRLKTQIQALHDESKSKEMKFATKITQTEYLSPKGPLATIEESPSSEDLVIVKTETSSSAPAMKKEAPAASAPAVLVEEKSADTPKDETKIEAPTFICSSPEAFTPMPVSGATPPAPVTHSEEESYLSSIGNYLFGFFKPNTPTVSSPAPATPAPATPTKRI